MESLLTKDERESFLQEREERLARNYKRGKIIVTTIAITYFIFTIISSIIKLNILGLVINISAAWALWYGVKWVRFYFAFAVVVQIIAFFTIIFNPGLLSALPSWGLFLAILQLIFGIVSVILLFKSEGVRDFMEYQREAPC